MAAIVEPPPAPSIHRKPVANHDSCPTCGSITPLDTVMNLEGAKQRIMELEAQIELLKEKATAAGMYLPSIPTTRPSTCSTEPKYANKAIVDKCADYEDQIRILSKSKMQDRLLRSNTGDFPPSRSSEDTPRPSTAGATTSRFSFLTGRRTSPPNNTPFRPPVPPKDSDVPADLPIDIALFNELERERALRTEAEARANKVDSEIEELSVQLFSQANEMVAEERKARAKLEERVETLERRDREKMGRLERLEKAVNRVERVKALLQETERKGPPSVTVGNEKHIEKSMLLSPPAKNR